MTTVEIGSKVRFVIATRDSARWVGVFYGMYRRLGIQPLYVCDSRSRDDTIGILRRAGAEVAEFTPTGDFVEAGIAQHACEVAGTPWVLRLDDDEFPSIELVRWLHYEFRSTNPAVFISRRELFRHQGKVVYSRSVARYGRPDRPGYLHGQQRLFRPALVEPFNEVHSPGFREPVFYDYAPPAAFFAHFSCLLRTPEERLEKIRHYERIKLGSSWCCGDEYLPELFDAAHHNPAQDDIAQFEPLVTALPLAKPSPQFALSTEDRQHMNSELGTFVGQIKAGQAAYAQRMAGSPEPTPPQQPIQPELGQYFDLSEISLPRCVDHASGFSFQETWGRWILGSTASIRFTTPLPRRLVLEIRCQPFAPLVPCDVAVLIGQRTATLKFEQAGLQDYVIIGDMATCADTITFTIRAPPKSPAKLGISDDARQLGLGIARLHWRPLSTEDVVSAVESPTLSDQRAWLV